MMEPSIPNTIHLLQRLLFPGRQGDSPDRPQPLFTAPSPFLQTLCPAGLSAGALPGHVQGLRLSRVSLLHLPQLFLGVVSFLSNYPSIRLLESVFYVKSQENLQLDKSRVSGPA